MTMLRCTAKLLKELGAAPVELPSAVDDLYCWHANLLRFDRRKCILFTHDLSLYSVFVPAWTKPRFAAIGSEFGQALFRSLRCAEFSQARIERMLGAMAPDGSVRIGKTNNRSVLGSMNDLAFQIECDVSTCGGLAYCSVDDLNQRLNRIPMSAIHPHTYSIDALREALDAQGP